MRKRQETKRQRRSKMVNVDKAVIARLKSHGHTFEILVDSDMALELKAGKGIDIKNVLAAQKVFTDAHKGLAAAEGAMKEVFGTADHLEAAKAIIEKGEVQITAEHKAKLREQKYRQIVNMIHVNGVDPTTHHPHPLQRIENALAEAKFHLHEFEPVQRQVQEALKLLRPILPIKFEIKEISVKIPPEFAAKSYGIINSFGTKLREDWQNDGSLLVLLEIPGGLESDFYDKINALTHGNVEAKVQKVR